MQKSLIASAVLQQVLDSAPNAAAKGQAQYFTPEPWAKVLSIPLPKYRPTIVDLTCGSGQLLGAAARHSKNLLGCDIDPTLQNANTPVSFIPSDITLLYPLLKVARFQADLFVLNPPWDLYWSRERLAFLAECKLPAVGIAFAKRDGRTAAGTIDSTIAALCLALDLSTYYGEGFLIANESTLQRLIFAPDAPHAALAAHLWAHLIIPGNFCVSSTLNSQPSTFRTGIIYFAAGHTIGNPRTYECGDLKAAEVTCQLLRDNRLLWRKGPDAREYLTSETTAEAWAAVAEEWDRLYPVENQKSKIKNPYNLWLDRNGTIATALSLFDKASDRYTQQQAAVLNELNGKHPLQLVLQRHSRRILEEAAGLVPINPSIHHSNNPSPSPWRVHPDLTAAVQQAIRDYNAVRAPLYPLSKIQRLGYLDEQDDIRCIKPLGQRVDGSPFFVVGASYPLRSTTVRVQRSGTKINLHGELDHVEWDGQELAFFITDAAGAEHAFMEARLRDKSVKVTIARGKDAVPGVPHSAVPLSPSEFRKLKPEDSVPCPIDFTLQELVEHFDIPAVPDVAALQPDAYQHNLKLLEEIETLCS